MSKADHCVHVLRGSEQWRGKTLLQLAGTMGKKDPHGLRIETKISHEELSVMVGTTRSRISMFMERFRKHGGCLRRTENTLSSSKKTSSLITWL
jgi:hypothetical protein